MPLQVFTRRIGPWMKDNGDAIDITRKSAATEWLFLAPSWQILRPALDARKKADELLEETLGLDPTARSVAEQWLAEAWNNYVPRYMAEMRVSYRQHRPSWDGMLERPYLVLCCYCPDPVRCHRAILRQNILPKLGAKDCGEIVPKVPSRLYPPR